MAAVLDYPPSVDEYKRVSRELIAAGEDVETFSRLYSHFGSWPRAREALLLSETDSVRLIDARFRRRRVGKVWRYSREATRAALAACVGDLRRVPLMSEYITDASSPGPRGRHVASTEHDPRRTPATHRGGELRALWP